MTVQKQAPRALPSNTAGSAVNDLFEQLTENTEWHRHAACRGLPTDWFFLNRDEPVRDEVLEACGSCPVSDRCRAEKERTNAVGVWGSQIAHNTYTRQDCTGCGKVRYAKQAGYPKGDLCRKCARRNSARLCVGCGRDQQERRAVRCRACYLEDVRGVWYSGGRKT